MVEVVGFVHWVTHDGEAHVGRGWGGGITERVVLSRWAVEVACLRLNFIVGEAAGCEDSGHAQRQRLHGAHFGGCWVVGCKMGGRFDQSIYIQALLASIP